MSQLALTAASGPPGAATPHAGTRQGLLTLIRVRALVAIVALPMGVLLRPDASEASSRLLVTAAVAVGVVSVLFWLAARSGRALAAQLYAQLAADLGLVTALAAATGGRESQFVLFFALVVITGGLLGRLVGGLFAAVGACAAYLMLPSIALALGHPKEGVDALLPPPGMLIAFLMVVGVLAGVLGGRVRRAHDDLQRTARELDRVRVDNDVILRQLATGVFTVDAGGTIAYVNPAAEQVLGVHTPELRGRRIQDALPERLAPLRDVIVETLARGATRTRVEILTRSANDRPLPLGVSTNLLMHEGAVTGVVSVFQDLTEVREMERRARRNQTLAEVGALSAAIAHELRNGLKPISGSVEYLQRELKLEGENAVLMGLIHTECNRLNRFVTDLLTYSRERDLAPERIELNEHLAELCEGVKRMRSPSDRSTVQFVPDTLPGEVRADREQLRQVWLNLISNAVDAMPDGGCLTVRWRVDAGDRAVIEFTDEGSGIAAADLPRVGEPFFTTKEGGTGLGLAIAQRIVERHGGTLMFDSAPGRGTTARVTIPGVTRPLALAA
jgi:two-component system sensor histidine kinase PilS (NtrC family)